MVDVSFPGHGTASRSRLMASPEARAWVMLGAGLGLWLVLAIFARTLLPDAQTAGGGSFLPYLKRTLINVAVFFLFVGVIRMGAHILSGDKESWLKARLQAWRANGPRGAAIVSGRILAAFVSFSLFIFAYSALKVRIGAVAPFAWDERFMLWDRALFLGRDPWTLFAWLYDMPSVVMALDFLYDFWAVVLAGIWTICLVRTDRSVAERFRFPVALLICWFVGGNVMAAALSSAGPVYYDAVTGLTGPYAVQLDALYAVGDLRAEAYQGILWQIHESGAYGLGGISAMPSMHCATAALLVLLAWPSHAWRVFALAFFAVVFVSSFVLAWHYALDGVVGAGVAALSWWLAGRVCRRVAKPETKAAA